MRRPARFVLLGSSFLSGLLLLGPSACVPRARMCTASTECADKSVCVAGRCQVDKPTARPAVDSARRVVLRPVDVAYVKNGDGPSGGALPPLFALGKDGGKLFLRFSAVIPSTAKVVEAYVVLHRSSLVDEDPTPVSIHATRIVDGWSGRSVSWALQPRVLDTRSPSTLVEPSGSRLVRLDVRELVRQWPRRDPQEQGIAIVADNDTRTGTLFALSGIGLAAEPAGTGRSTVAPSAAGAPDLEPYLELYLR